MAKLGPFETYFIPLHDPLYSDYVLRYKGTMDRFDVGCALHFLMLSNLAYYDPERGVKEQVLVQGYDTYTHLSGKSGNFEPQGYVISNEDYAVLVLRGTEPVNLKDWLTDLEIGKIHTPYGSLHTGFYHSIEILWAEIFQTLGEVGVLDGKPLYITGHSLGAGMATVAAMMLYHKRGIKPRAVYTFGSPRVMDAEGRYFYQYFYLNDITYRIINNNDVVCDLPLWIHGYRHIGEPIYLDSHSMIRRKPPASVVAFDSFRGALRSLRKIDLDLLSDHFTTSYKKALECNLPR
jgi:hypothetical protein